MPVGGAVDRLDGQPPIKGCEPDIVLYREGQKPGIRDLAMTLQELGTEHGFVEERDRVGPEPMLIGRAQLPEVS